MSLTGTPFFAVTLLVLVAAMALLAFVWNRIPGPRPVRYAGRLGATMFSQVAAVVVVLVYVNNTMGPFYDNWEDLFGGAANQSATATNVAGGASNGGAPGQTGEKLRFKTYLPGVLQTTARGSASGVVGSLYVWLPPQYNDPAYAHTDFPVVELLPGTPGTPQAWFGSMKVQDAIAPLLAAGKVKPMILVSAKLNVLPGGVDPGCADVPGAAKTATWLDQDVPQLIAANFRTAHGARDWALMGYSAGAYCAVNLTVQHPGTFHAAVSLSGYNAPEAPLVLKDPALARANNPYALLKHEKRQPDIALLMAGSAQDPGTVPDAKALLAVLHTPGPNQLLTVARGGHTTDVWRTMLPDALAWLSRQFG
ncbi:enterochelin esterase-like enzyme [Streptacidiphilus sp. MAP12-20]|uniref:alpha/beta hydrolase n=1 Tax=Streptacidiphilus sp. MAP12-20 TaxID=3156299 RepID=UPI003511A40F